MNIQITIRQAAATLGVSEATVRNWIRLGKIRNVTWVSNKAYLNAAEIDALCKAIESGDLPYLKSRRNKHAVQGQVIPINYLANPQAAACAEAVMQVAEHLQEEERLFVLLEVYLRLLWLSGKINLMPENSGRPLVNLWLAGKLELGYYAGIVTEFWESYGQCSSAIDSSLAKLAHMNWFFHTGEDLLGLIYMSMTSLRKRKGIGCYYTPSSIAARLIEVSLQNWDCNQFWRIVDPCCGSGNFLIHIFLYLRHELLKANNDPYTVEKQILSMLTGYDNDPVAVHLAKMNLSLLLNCPELINNICIEHRDTLLDLDNNQAKFDLVIGNPPWGYQFPLELRTELASYYRTAQGKGKLESFTLFLEWAVNHAAPGGKISYVLPEAFLTVKMHRLARELILESCQVKLVERAGHIFAHVNTPVIMLVAQKSAEISYCHPVNLSTGFHIYSNALEQSIITHLQSLTNVAYLRDNADFALGIVTGRNADFLMNQPREDSEVVITGRQVYMYQVRTPVKYLVYQRDRLQQVAPEHFYRAPEKLVYRFVHRQLVVAYDSQQRLTLNSANIIIPRITGINMKYVLAVLNSRVAQFYHMVTQPSVKILRSHLESIPIVLCSETEQNSIVDLVNRILIAQNPVERRNLYEQIDQQLMDYYQLPKKFQLYIRQKFPIFKLL